MDLNKTTPNTIFFSGVTISTHKPRTTNKDAPALQPQDANNRKKFAFLSRETTPDYRPLGTWQDNHANIDNDVQVRLKIMLLLKNMSYNFFDDCFFLYYHLGTCRLYLILS